MFRSLMILSALTMGLAMPAAAQHISDQDAWKAGDSVVQAHNRASQAKDAAGLAAVREYFEQFWQQSLTRFRAVASQPVREES